MQCGTLSEVETRRDEAKTPKPAESLISNITPNITRNLLGTLGQVA